MTWQQSGSFKTLIQPNSGKMRSTSPAGDLKEQLCLAGKGLEKYLLTTWGHVYSIAPRRRERETREAGLSAAPREKLTRPRPKTRARMDGLVVSKRS